MCCDVCPPTQESSLMHALVFVCVRVLLDYILLECGKSIANIENFSEELLFGPSCILK